MNLRDPALLSCVVTEAHLARARKRKALRSSPAELAVVVQMFLSEGKLARARRAYELLAGGPGGHAAADAYLRETGGVTENQLRTLHRPHQRSGRPREDKCYCAVVGAVDVARIGRKDLLRCLGLDESRAAQRLVSRALRRGHQVLSEEEQIGPSPGPGVAAVAFLIGYHKDDRPGLLEALLPYLVELPGVNRNEQRQILAKLLRAVPLPPPDTR